MLISKFDFIFLVYLAPQECADVLANRGVNLNDVIYFYEIVRILLNIC
jgi:hypothetical protein